MEEKDNKRASSFLDKFKGRANKVDKTGINNALDSVKSSTPQNQKEPTSRNRLPSLDHKFSQQHHGRSRADIDSLMQSPLAKNQEGNLLVKKLSTPSKRKRTHVELLPPLNDSPTNANKKDSQIKPPSRPVSDRSQKLERRVFGKYLKLDNEAMKHLEYLQQMDKDRAKRKASGYSTQR